MNADPQILSEGPISLHEFPEDDSSPSVSDRYREAFVTPYADNIVVELGVPTLSTDNSGDNRRIYIEARQGAWRVYLHSDDSGDCGIVTLNDDGTQIYQPPQSPSTSEVAPSLSAAVPAHPSPATEYEWTKPRRGISHAKLHSRRWEVTVDDRDIYCEAYIVDRHAPDPNKPTEEDRFGCRDDAIKWAEGRMRAIGLR